MRRIQRTILVTFTFSLIILLAVGLASILMTQDFLRDADWNDHSRRVLNALNDMRAALLEARGAARALIIDPTTNDLGALVAAQNRAREKLAVVRQLTADNPQQRQRLEQLSVVVDERLKELLDGVDFWNKNQQDRARALLAGPEGVATMQQFQNHFDVLVRAEEVLLQERRTRLTATARSVMIVTGAGAVLAAALVSLAFWRIRAGLLDRAQAVDELALARREAEAANRFKSDFLANMSHEIRSPVAAIIGYADILLDLGMSASERLEAINAVRRNGMHLLTLINDILDLSKVEAGRLHVEQIECAPCLVIGDVASMMRVRAAEKKLTLEIKVEGVIPEKIHSDPMRLRQILINLLSNAIKFTEQGWVRLVVRMGTPTDDPRPRLCFDVIDTGVGMSPEEAAQIFKPFVQGDSTTTRRFGGTGLGLSISRRLAEFLGGTLTVDSAPGRGSTFRLEIQTGPLNGVPLINRCTESTYDADSGEYRPAEYPAPGSQGRVLVAEDGQDNRNLIAYLLRRGGYHVEFAENGRLAVQAVTDAQRLDRPFDLILMDMQMPEMDGYAATTKLRSLGYSTPIVALTANAMKNDRDRCLAAGCTDYLSKPVDRRLLWQCVQRHIARTAPADKPAELKPARAGAGEDQAVVEGMTRLRQDFIAHLPIYVSDLTRGLATQDGATVQRVLHQLSGIGGVFDLQWLTDEATPLDRDLKSGAPVAPLVPRIEALIARVRQVEGYDPAWEMRA